MSKKMVKAIITIIIVFLLVSLYLLLPATSPFKSIHDADGDGFPDIEDRFPNDPTEWQDSDNDGVGDNSDAFPYNILEFNDADSDGVGDNSDIFPEDPSESIDTDGDGIGNNADEDDDNDTYLDNLDAFPLNSNEWEDWDNDNIGDNNDYVNIQLTHENETTSRSYRSPFLVGNTLYYVESNWWLYSSEPYIKYQSIKSMQIPSETETTHITFQSEYQANLGHYIDEVLELIYCGNSIYIVRTKTIIEGYTTYKGCSAGIQRLNTDGTTSMIFDSDLWEFYTNLATDGTQFVYSHDLDNETVGWRAFGGSEITSYTDDITTPDVYDSNIVYVVDEDTGYSIDLYNISTHSITRLAEATTDIYYLQPRIHKNQVVWTKVDDSGDNKRYSIQIYDLNTQDLVTLTDDMELIGIADFSDDLIVYNVKINGSRYMTLLDIITNESRNIAPFSGRASIGTNYIAFSDSRMGNLYYTKAEV